MVEKNPFRLPRPALIKLKAELAKLAISERAKTIIDRLLEQWAADPRIVVSRIVSQEISNHGPSHQIALEAKGELDAILIDGRKCTTVDSIYARLIRRTLETYPVNGAPKKVRLPPSMLIKTRDERAKAAKKRVHERELAAAPSPTGEAKRGRRRPKTNQSELTATGAE